MSEHIANSIINETIKNWLKAASALKQQSDSANYKVRPAASAA